MLCWHACVLCCVLQYLGTKPQEQLQQEQAEQQRWLKAKRRLKVQQVGALECVCGAAPMPLCVCIFCVCVSMIGCLCGLCVYDWCLCVMVCGCEGMYTHRWGVVGSEKGRHIQGLPQLEVP